VEVDGTKVDSDVVALVDVGLVLPPAPMVVVAVSPLPGPGPPGPGPGMI
jgi:hypothetical protein